MRALGRFLVGIGVALVAIFGIKWLTREETRSKAERLSELEKLRRELECADTDEETKKALKEDIDRRTKEVERELESMSPRRRVDRLLEHVPPPSDKPGIWG